MMWLLHHETGKEKYKEIGVYTEDLLDECFQVFYGLHHDVGFMWLPTSVANYKVTKNPESRKRALHAANLLAGRFNLAGGFIRAWNDLEGLDTRGWAIIDCMINIPLLYWATEEPGMAYEDSTAAAIAACGLIEIAKAVRDLEKDVYLSAALKLLKTLDASRCDWSTEADHIVINGSGAYHQSDRHISIIYGDYYFIEAVFKLKGNDLYLW